MRIFALIVILLLSVILLWWAYVAFIAMDPHPANPFYPPSRLQRLGFPVSLIVAFGLQLVFAWVSRPQQPRIDRAWQGKAWADLPWLWAHFWFRAFVAFCLTMMILFFIFVVALFFSGV